MIAAVHADFGRIHYADDLILLPKELSGPQERLQ